VSLLVTLIISVPTAYFAAPYVKRPIRIHWLISMDRVKRQRGLNYVAVNANEDSRVLASTLDQLEGIEDENFQQIVGALQAAGCWEREKVTNGSWLRWVGLLASEPDVEAGSLAAQRLADLHDLADDARVVGLLRGLLSRVEPDVRYNALCAVAELANSAADRSPYLRMVSVMTTDTDSSITRHAWLFGHYLGTVPDNAPAWLGTLTHTAERPPADHERFTFEPIRALLLSPEAPLRDVGCVIAARDLSADELDVLISDLLNDMNDQAKMSAAILSGMTGLHKDTLLRQSQSQSQNDWAVRRVLELGLWMQDASEDTDTQLANWLMPGDIPRTTVLLAMLYREETRWQGLDTLLNPRGESPDDLPALLDDYGWWRVLNQYLPDGTPHWRPGGDSESQRLQVDMLRDWYLVNRKRLMNNS